MSAYEVTDDERRARILVEIGQERERQQQLHYDLEHDDEYGVVHLVQIAGEYSRRAVDAPTRAIGRSELITCAAIIVAAAELIDRKAGA